MTSSVGVIPTSTYALQVCDLQASSPEEFFKKEISNPIAKGKHHAVAVPGGYVYFSPSRNALRKVTAEDKEREYWSSSCSLFLGSDGQNVFERFSAKRDSPHLVLLTDQEHMLAFFPQSKNINRDTNDVDVGALHLLEDVHLCLLVIYCVRTGERIFVEPNVPVEMDGIGVELYREMFAYHLFPSGEKVYRDFLGYPVSRVSNARNPPPLYLGRDYVLQYKSRYGGIVVAGTEIDVFVDGGPTWQIDYEVGWADTDDNLEAISGGDRFLALLYRGYVVVHHVGTGEVWKKIDVPDVIHALFSPGDATLWLVDNYEEVYRYPLPGSQEFVSLFAGLNPESSEIFQQLVARGKRFFY